MIYTGIPFAIVGGVLIVTPSHEVDKTNLKGVHPKHGKRRPEFNPAKLTLGFADSEWNLIQASF